VNTRAGADLVSWWTLVATKALPYLRLRAKPQVLPALLPAMFECSFRQRSLETPAGYGRAMMWFSSPAPVRSATKPGLTHNVSNVQTASEQLLTWAERGPKWRKAVQVCMAALEGEKSPIDARQAFEAAAKEAKMLRSFGH
jgi:hypothetical protein